MGSGKGLDKLNTRAESRASHECFLIEMNTFRAPDNNDIGYRWRKTPYQLNELCTAWTIIIETNW